MKVLVACEHSGRVREAFRAKGHDAWSCDAIPSSSGYSPYHIVGDVREYLHHDWDMMLAFPPCTYLTNAGARWFVDPDDPTKPHPDHIGRSMLRSVAISFFNQLANCPHIPKICIENSQPSKYVMDRVGRYTQKIQPWMFGEPYTKGACLWLKNLPPLVPTHKKPLHIEAACHKMPPGPNRGHLRGITYQCVADAMAEAWG